MKKFVKEIIQTQVKLMQEVNPESIIKLSSYIINAINKNKKVFFMGNGGSAATASHICADFNRYLINKKNKKSFFYCLNDNVALMTSIANDLSYEDIFIEQLKGFLQKDDVIIAISGKGNSKNVINAVKYANKQGAVSLALCGYDGGELLKCASFYLHTENSDMQVVENMHLILLHIILKYLIKLNAYT